MKMSHAWRTAENHLPQLIIPLTPLLQLTVIRNVMFLKNLTENMTKLNFLWQTIHGTSMPAICILITFTEFVPEDGK